MKSDYRPLTVEIPTDEKSAGHLVPQKEIDEIFEIYQDRNSTDFKQYETLDGFLTKLQVDKNLGLDQHNVEDIKKRRQLYSSIEDTPEKTYSVIAFILNALEDVMLRLLLIVAFISITLGVIESGWEKGWIEGCSILFSVVIVVTIQTYTDYKKQKQFAVLHKIQSTSEHETKRNGHYNIINVKEWVVGDIIQITPGCVPKADGILVSCDIAIQADEQNLSGEVEVKYKEVGSCIFEGCPIVDGYGEMIVLRLGKNSCQGRIRHQLSEEEEETTPLQEKLEDMANQIGVLAIVAATLTFATLISFQIYTNIESQECFFCVSFLRDLVRHLMVGFGIVIMAIPEGLPLSVTIALAYSVHQMYLERNLVKKLKSCETMGGVSDICTDKTGTLTYGNMILKKILLNQNTYNVEALTNNNSQTKDLLLKIIQNTSKAIVDEAEDGTAVQKGNITEIGLIKWLLEQSNPRSYYNLQKIKEFPFTSKNRCSGTVVSVNGTYYLYVKGQPDSIIPNCSTTYEKENIVEFDEEKKKKVSSTIEEHQVQSFRGLVFAVKKINDKNLIMANDQIELIDLISEKDLTFVATCFLQDCVREEVPKAVEMLKRAGVTTRMITGDAVLTAKAIAIITGIISKDENESITTGFTIGQMSESELAECVDKFKVVAKCSPEQKLKFVRALKQQNKVVAVTGDGTNDAPCFQVSDVSFTMGKNGTEIIKEAGDIILLDDNYASIITACSWGRNIQEGIRKFLVFQLTVNIVGVLISLMGSIILRESPLSSSQMLWINLIMDTFASMALATDHPTEDLLKRQPYGRNEDLINGFMKRNIVFQCVYQMIVLSFVMIYADNVFDVPPFKHLDENEYSAQNAAHMTIFFHTFVMLQLFNEFNCRDLRHSSINPFSNLFRNSYFTIIMVVSIAIQYMLVQFGGQTFNCSPITLPQHLFCVAIGFGSILVGVITRLIPNTFFNRFSLFRDNSQDSVVEPAKNALFTAVETEDIICKNNEEPIIADKKTTYDSLA